MIEEDARVLIVDDDVDVCNVLGQIISRLGIGVETISNPLEVPDLVRNVFFNLILLDIRMPGKSGMELLPEIAEISPDTKIIIISGFGDKELAIRSLRLGAFDFLEKPFDHKLISHSIERALETQKAQLAYWDEKIKLQDANRQ
ncbi:MAG: response regulator, partial [Desulfobacteraceae bacterium]|nr:response regulator [Desulfobacteraceae bacterium]